jgi:hypothetical protein
MNDVDKVIASVIAMAHLSISLGHFRSDYKSQIYYTILFTYPRVSLSVCPVRFLNVNVSSFHMPLLNICMSCYLQVGQSVVYLLVHKCESLSICLSNIYLCPSVCTLNCKSLHYELHPYFYL